MKIIFGAGNESIVGREIIETAFVVRTLPIFETAELNVTRVRVFSLFDDFAIFRDSPVAQIVGNEKLKSPNNVSGVFNIARFFEGFKGDRLRIVSAVERADDNESGVSVALKVFKFANNVINSLFCGSILKVGRNNLEVVKNNDRSFIDAKFFKFK